MATALSYGSLPRGAPSRAWRQLERLHGPLGWRPSGLVFHDQGGGLAALSRLVPIPLARVDPPAWLAGRRRALAAAGVRQVVGRVRGLRARPGGGWRLEWSGPVREAGGDGDSVREAVGDGGSVGEGGDGSELEADVVVLAAGAGARALWPGLPGRLRHSWAGVLHLESLAGAGGAADRWLSQARQGRIVQPRHWQRPALEAASATSEEPLWIVDAGLAPRGEGVVVGQITWIPPAASQGAPGGSLEPPDPDWMEPRLREGLARLDPALAALEAPYRQVPVSFCPEGQPLAGPVAEAPGLWVFAGFSAAFSRVPARAEELARQLLP